MQQRPNLYENLSSNLSFEFEDEFKWHREYDVTHKAQDRLWKALEEIHLTTTVSKERVVVLQAAQANYMKLIQRFPSNNEVQGGTWWGTIGI